MTLQQFEKQREKTVCPHCKETVHVDLKIEDLDAIDSSDRGMGSEIEYSFTAEAECPNCQKTFELEGSLWEYPEGVINLIEVRQ
ncbi:hypothetical protein A9D36_09570 [Bacillus subtilis]|nr:hypothetical protein A9D36_09570 [Bacillus subtilis]